MCAPRCNQHAQNEQAYRACCTYESRYPQQPYQKYGVIAPPAFWSCIAEQLCYLFIGMVVAACALFLLLTFCQPALQPLTRQRRYHGDFHLALAMTICGGACWWLSVSRRSAYAEVYWYRQDVLKYGAVPGDVLTKIWSGVEMVFWSGMGLVVGTVLLSLVWYLLQTIRDLISPGRSSCKNMFRVLRRWMFGVPLDDSFPPPPSPRSTIVWFPPLSSFAVSAFAENWWRKHWWQGTGILTCIASLLMLWVADFAEDRIQEGWGQWTIQRLALGLHLAEFVVTARARDAHSVCLYWEGLTALACLYGALRVVAEFMPQAEDSGRLPGEQPEVVGKVSSG